MGFDVLLRIAAAAIALVGPVSAPALSVVVAARAVQPGELVVLTARATDLVTVLRAHAFDRALQPFRVDDHTWRVLDGIDLDVHPGTYPEEHDADTPSGHIEAVHRLVVTDKKFQTRRLVVAPGYVNPPPEVLVRIEEEAARLNRVWTESAAARLWTTPFIRPVPQAANSAFGTRLFSIPRPSRLSAHQGTS